MSEFAKEAGRMIQKFRDKANDLAKIVAFAESMERAKPAVKHRRRRKPGPKPGKKG